MASNKRPSTSECSQTKNQRRINVSDPNFRESVVENLTYSESDDSSADEQYIMLPPETEFTKDFSSNEETERLEEPTYDSVFDEPSTSQGPTRKFYYVKRRSMKWAAEPPSRNRRTQAQNIIVPVPNVNVPSDSEPESLFSLFLTQNIKGEIIRQHTEKRLQTPQLSHELKGLISRVLGIDASHQEETIPENSRLNVRKNWYLFYKQKHRKTAYVCHICKKPICLQCSKPACNACC